MYKYKVIKYYQQVIWKNLTFIFLEIEAFEN